MSLADLTEFDCVLPTDARPIGTALRDLFEAKGVPWRQHLHVTDNLTIAMRLVATSNAFALTSEEVASSSSFSEAFEKILCNSWLPPFLLCCATRSRWEVSAPVAAFVRRMKAARPPFYGGG